MDDASVREYLYLAIELADLRHRLHDEFTIERYMKSRNQVSSEILYYWVFHMSPTYDIPTLAYTVDVSELYHKYRNDFRGLQLLNDRFLRQLLIQHLDRDTNVVVLGSDRGLLRNILLVLSELLYFDEVGKDLTLLAAMFLDMFVSSEVYPSSMALRSYIRKTLDFTYSDAFFNELVEVMKTLGMDSTNIRDAFRNGGVIDEIDPIATVIAYTCSRFERPEHETMLNNYKVAVRAPRKRPTKSSNHQVSGNDTGAGQGGGAV